MSRDELLKRLTILDFMAVDLALYLNTHCNDKEAIEKYNDVIKQADACRMQYEKMVGPLCSYRSLSREQFTWVDEPWPWQRSFNFDLIGEGTF